jgi:hypothetical protein
MAEERLQRRLAAILSADVVGYVPSSSRSMSAEKPATSAARIAAKRRSIRSPVKKCP